MPDWTPPLSAQGNDTANAERFQPSALGAGVTTGAPRVGSVVSIFTPTVVGGAMLPAMSVQPPETTAVPAVSELTVAPPVASVATPEPGVGSSQPKATLTGVLLCQPKPLAAGVTVGTALGGRESTFTVVAKVPDWFFATSRAMQPMWWVPCPATDDDIALPNTSAGDIGPSALSSPQEIRVTRLPDSGSSPLMPRVTGLVRHQPASPSGRPWLNATVGGVLSTRHSTG